MIREITTLGRLDAVVQVPGSKSITNRALVCAALAQGTSTITGASDSDDTVLLANGLDQMGVLVRRREDTLEVEGKGGRLFAPKLPVPVGNAGTTSRFLLALGALAPGVTTLSLDSRMSERPMDELFGALRSAGIDVSGGAGVPRLVVKGGSFAAREITVRTDRSSQFVSALMLIAPCLPGGLTLRTVGDGGSLPYVAMTAEVMKKFGAVSRTPAAGSIIVDGGGYRAGRYGVEPDASGASYFFAATAIAGGRVMVSGMRRTSLQGDAAILTFLERMGCRVGETGQGISLESSGVLRGIDVNMGDTPDLVPTVAVTALFAGGESRLRNVGRLRFKESDRLAALVKELGRAGAQIRLEEDHLLVSAGPLVPCTFDTYEDHRLAMSFALIGLKVAGVAVENPAVVKKSFPSFWKEFDKLYGG